VDEDRAGDRSQRTERQRSEVGGQKVKRQEGGSKLGRELDVERAY